MIACKLKKYLVKTRVHYDKNATSERKRKGYTLKMNRSLKDAKKLVFCLNARG